MSFQTNRERHDRKCCVWTVCLSSFKSKFILVINWVLDESAMTTDTSGVEALSLDVTLAYTNLVSVQHFDLLGCNYSVQAYTYLKKT